MVKHAFETSPAMHNIAFYKVESFGAGAPAFCSGQCLFQQSAALPVKPGAA
jgi:hypothetical protein